MNKSFKELGLNEPIINAIKEMGFQEPTLVQSESIPHILNKKDLIVMSKTGSGKTGAFGLPVLQSIDPEGKGPQGLFLTPTRELAVQVDSELKKMSKNLKVKTTAVYGQHNMNVEIQALENGIAVVTGTPGRVFDHINRRTLNTKNIKFVVLDEADRMLDMGFIDQVERIIKALPKDRVTLLFSATMPKEIQKICKAYMKDPVTIELEADTKTVDSIRQSYYRVENNEKRTQLNRLLTVEQPDSCMVFCNTRHEVDKVAAYLGRKGYITDSLHGANSQSNRMRTIEKFKKGALQILVATDVAARGIHIDDLTLVINYDVPGEKDSYVHRIGRTGRAGNGGKAITLVTSDDIMSLYDIEEHVGVMISEEDLPTEEHVRECANKADGKWTQVKEKRTTSQNATRNHKPKYHSDQKPKDGQTKHHKPVQHKQNINKPKYEKAKYEKPAHHNNKPDYRKPENQKPLVKPVIKQEVKQDVIVKKSLFGFIKKLFNKKSS